jgi:hypothetical protein
VVDQLIKKHHKKCKPKNTHSWLKTSVKPDRYKIIPTNVKVVPKPVKLAIATVQPNIIGPEVFIAG